jgi:hypothetical protein
MTQEGTQIIRNATAILAAALGLVVPTASWAQSAPVRLKPLDHAAPHASQPAPEYPVGAHVDLRQWTPSGLGFSATGWGRSMDLSHWDGWASDPHARPSDMEAGLRWRGDGVSATAGYSRPWFNNANAIYPHSVKPADLFGLSVTFRDNDPR